MRSLFLADESGDKQGMCRTKGALGPFLEALTASSCKAKSARAVVCVFCLVCLAPGCGSFGKEAELKTTALLRKNDQKKQEWYRLYKIKIAI